MERSTSLPPNSDSPRPRIPENAASTPTFLPRSSAFVAVLVLAFLFGALSFLPFLGAVLFYPASALAGSGNFVTRSAIGDVLQILYQFLLMEFGYLLGRRVRFERDYLFLLLPAYFGAVLGYLIGLPGLQTTTVAGGIFLFIPDPFDPVHVQSAFFNSPALMGMMFTGMGLAFVLRLKKMTSLVNELTSSGTLLLVFFIVAFFSFLGYMMPPAFYILLSSVVGPTAATTGALYSVTTNSGIIANPFLLFLVLFLVGDRVKLVRDSGTVLTVLFIAFLVGATAGNPIGSYVTSYVASGAGTFPNYFANANVLGTFLTLVVAVSFAGACIGLASISLAFTRNLRKSGVVTETARPPPPA